MKDDGEWRIPERNGRRSEQHLSQKEDNDDGERWSDEWGTPSRGPGGRDECER
jgi:hypothetical protein